jgi:hypothetical protein
MRVTRSPWLSSVAPQGRDHAGRTCLSATHETGRPTAAGFRKPFHIRASAQTQPAAIHQRYCLDRMTLMCSAAGIRWL